ncbi:MAG: SGNH/GDSL hydrolase family protein [Phycisphaerae bacterium]
MHPPNPADADATADPSTSPSSRARRLFLRTTVVAAAILLALVTAEAIVRIAGVDPVINVVYRRTFRLSENKTLVYELNPGSPDGRFRISKQGLRDREFPYKKSDNTFRIVVLGDSVTYGFNTPRDQSYPKQLERLLNRCAGDTAPHFEVINLGVTGYNIPQIVESLRTKGLRFHPDLIIYGYVLNDPQSYSLEAAALDDLNRQARQILGRAVPRGLAQALSYSRLYRLYLAARLKPPRKVVGEIGDPGYMAFLLGSVRGYIRAIHNNPAPWKRIQDGLADLAELTAGPRTIPLVMAVFPIAEKTGFADYALADVHRKVIREARRHGLTTLDLTAAYRTVERQLDIKLFQDFLHPIANGHRVAATALLIWLSRSGLLPAGAIDLNRLTRDPAEDSADYAAITAALLAQPSSTE